MNLPNGLDRVICNVKGKYAFPATLDHHERVPMLVRFVADMLPDHKISASGIAVDGVITFRLFMKKTSWGGDTDQPDMIRMEIGDYGKHTYRKVHIKGGGVSRKEFHKKFNEIWERCKLERERAEAQDAKRKKLDALTREMREAFRGANTVERGQYSSQPGWDVYANRDDNGLYQFSLSGEKDVMLALAKALKEYTKEKKSENA